MPTARSSPHASTAAWWNSAPPASRKPPLRPAAPPAIGPASSPTTLAPASSPEPPSPTTQRSASTSPASSGGFAQSAGSPHTGAATASVTRGILNGDSPSYGGEHADRAASLPVGVPAGRAGRRRGAARDRRRSRARHAARRLPRRDLPDADPGRRRDGLVQPRPARDSPARRVRAEPLAAPRRAALHGQRRPRVRRRGRGLRGPEPAGRLDHAGDPRRLR